MLHARMIRNPCNIMLVCEKDKDRHRHNHPCKYSLLLKNKQTNNNKQIFFPAWKVGKKILLDHNSRHDFRVDFSPGPHVVYTKLFNTRSQRAELQGGWNTSVGDWFKASLLKAGYSPSVDAWPTWVIPHTRATVKLTIMTTLSVSKLVQSLCTQC